MQFVHIFALLSVCSALSYPHNYGVGSHRIATSLMMDVGAHQNDCFFQHFTEGCEVQIFGRIIDREGLWMIIEFSSPSGKIHEYRKTKDHAELKVDSLPDTGDYKICVTSNSPYGPARLTLEIFGFHPDEWNEALMEQQNKVALHRGMKNNTHNMFTHTWNAYYHLKYSNIQTLTDTYAQEKNRQYIDNFSFFQCAIILTCAFIQVVVIRKFFEVRDRKRPYA